MLSRKFLKRSSPLKSPKLANSSLRKRTLLKKLSGAVQFGATSKANLKVVVRVRPENQREIDNNARSVIDIVDEHMLVFDPSHEEEDFFFQGNRQKFRDPTRRSNKEQKFVFEKVFDPSSTNKMIFEATMKDIIEDLLSGYNCSVFAYGATGSGKTYTMIGQEDCPGITFLSVMELYDKIAELAETKTCEVGVSYLEVYNEMVKDLLSPGKPLNLHESGQHMQVTGLSFHKPKDASDLMRILAEGNLNRSQHPTDANAESSRSHAVFQVFIRQQERSSDLKSSISIAKLSMIDLAGSERGAATGFKGARFREGANINRSLLALGNCINALADGKGHIPYRDSKLTRLLKDSLGGNCRSVMIANITRSAMSYEDTYNTLRYANRAKTIKSTLKKNLLNVDQHVSQYMKIVEELKREVAQLKEQLKGASDADGVCVSNEERENYQQTIRCLKEQIEEKRSLSEKENSAQKQHMEKLMELAYEFKGYQREFMQMETREREMELKIYTQKVYIVRMKILAFASTKLEKGISKSERCINSYANHLDHVMKRKEVLLFKLSKIKDSILALCEEFKKKEVEENVEVVPEVNWQFRENELKQNVRDLIQVNEYFKNLVESLASSQESSEKLIVVLLHATKHFFLRLKAEKVCDPGSEQIWEKLFSMLDSSRIEWADTKNMDDSFQEQLGLVNPESRINISKLTKLPVKHVVHLTPLTNDSSKSYVRSCIQKKVGNLPSLSGEEKLASPLLIRSVWSNPANETFVTSYPGDTIESPLTSRVPLSNGDANEFDPAAENFVGRPESIEPCDSEREEEDGIVSSIDINGTFSIPSVNLDAVEYEKSKIASPDIENCKLSPCQKEVVGKIRPSRTPIKFSFSKLPHTLIRSASKKFIRSSSVPSLQRSDTFTNLPQVQSKGYESTLKKSESFLRPKFGSAMKNQENQPPKHVAFGTSFSASATPKLSTRRVLLPANDKRQ